MKVKTSAVALFLTILMPCVSAQQPGGAALSAPRYDTGIVSDNVYTNSCMGLSLSIPAGWTVFKESGDTDTTKIATHMPGGTMTLLTIDRPTDPPSTNRIVVIARDGAGFNGTAQEFVARSIQGWVDRYPGRFELMRSPFLIEYGGKQFYRGDYKQNLPQIGVMYSAYIFTKFRGYLIGAMLTTRSTADLDQLANALQRLSFAEDRTDPTCVVGDNTLTGRMVGVIGSVSSSGEKPTRVRVSQNVAKVTNQEGRSAISERTARSGRSRSGRVANSHQQRGKRRAEHHRSVGRSQARSGRHGGSQDLEIQALHAEWNSGRG